MPTLPFNPTQALSMLSGALSFQTTYRRDIFPLILSSTYINRNNFHVVEGRRGYLPEEAGTSEGQSVGTSAAFLAYQATGLTGWYNMGVNLAEALITYFYAQPVPVNPQPNDPIWLQHWAVIANDSVITKGLQTESDQFNFGHFMVPVSFTGGVGVIDSMGTNYGDKLADLYRVATSDAALKYKNVYAPLVAGTNIPWEYYISNYRLRGITYKFFPDGTRTPFVGTPGTIKLAGAYASFTGTALVVYSSWTGQVVSAGGRMEPYPMWFATDRTGRPRFLSCATDALAWTVDAFDDAFAATGNARYSRASLATQYTYLKALAIDNPSYFYKREDSTNPFRYPGSQAIIVNNSNGYTASRVLSAGSLQYYLRLDIAAAPVGNFPSVEVQNFVVQVAMTNQVTVYAEAACTETTVLELVMSTSQDANDTTQQYTAPWLVTGTSAPQSATFVYSDFVKWGTGTVWYPAIADVPLFTYSGSGGSIVVTTEQALTGGNKPVVQTVVMSKGSVGYAGCGLVNASFTPNPPRVRYSLVGSVQMRVKDSAGNLWYATLPPTGGAFSTFAPTWTTFANPSPTGLNIQEVVFEVAIGSATLKLYYCGADPIVIPTPSTVYKAVLKTKVKTAHTLWVGDFRPYGNQLDKLKYQPGVIPFTINANETALGSGVFDQQPWYGPAYAGYQSPYHPHKWGYVVWSQNVVQFLADAQDAYTRQSASSARGFLQQVFLWPIWYNADFATFGGGQYNIFTWNGPDPNTGWVNYINRPMVGLARYLTLNPGDATARRVLTLFFRFLQTYYNAGGDDPITDVPPVTNPQANYPEPHAWSLVGRAALHANRAGLEPELTLDIITRAYNYIVSQYVGSGTMAGSWSGGQPTFSAAGQTYREYFFFWHAEIVQFLSELIIYQNELNYPYESPAGVYPNLPPDYIEEIRLPPYKGNRNRFEDGNEQRVRNQDTGVGTQLTFKYEYLDATRYVTLLNFWKAQYGKGIPFTIPASVINHPSIVQTAIAGLGQTTYWRFADKLAFEVEVANEQRGIWKVSVKVESVVKL